MQIQKSYKQSEHEQKPTGKLYLTATPIGNLEDMTFRAVHTLQAVDWIAAEDTRQTQKLLNHYDIHTRMFSYHEHNKQASGKRVMELLLSGSDVALVSDAGTPAISDPGLELVRQAIDLQIPVIPIPGAVAGISALIASGMDTTSFTFVGFLPRDKKQQTEQLEYWKNHENTIIMYESPHRLTKTLKRILEVWGNRKIAIARELTKRHEEFIRGTVEEALEHFHAYPPLGELCILLEGNQEPALEENVWWDGMPVPEHVKVYIAKGWSKKEAIKQAAVDRGLPRREVYQQCFDLT